MRPDLFHIGSIALHSYGLMIAIGIIAAFYTTEYRSKKMGIDPEPVFSLGIWGVIGGILGAKILFWITELPSILKDPSLLLNIEEGFVVYGGIIGGILAAVLYCRFKKIKFMPYLDAAAPTIALAQGFGRIGCLLAGCCYGKETDAWFGIVFPEGSHAPAGVSLIPSQPIYSAANFLSFTILVLVSKRLKAYGQTGALYLIFYSIGRFVLEFIRGDVRGNVGVLSTSQFISIFILIAGVLLFVICGKFFKKDMAPKESERVSKVVIEEVDTGESDER